MQSDKPSAFSTTFPDRPESPSKARKVLGWVETAVIVFATTIAVLFVSFLAVMIGIA